MFADKGRVPICDTSGNTIWIRTKMDLGTRNKVQGALLGADVSTKSAELDLGAQLTALAVHNILAWDGPAFVAEDGSPISCSAKNICALDPSEPLVERAIAEITARNAPRSSPDPKSLAVSSGSMSAGGSDSTVA